MVFVAGEAIGLGSDATGRMINKTGVPVTAKSVQIA